MSDQTPSSPPEKLKRAHISWSDSYTKGHLAIESLSTILPTPLPPTLVTSETPASSLLHDTDVAAQVSALLRRPDSGAVNDNVCAWLYDTFHTSEPDLQLVVLRFLPVVAGVYLSRAALNKPFAGFESLLLAIYARETASRNGQAVTASIPDMSHPSVYHETKLTTAKINGSTELHLAVISPSLEPHGTVRSTRRARIVGVALELYYSKISEIPIGSKIDFCEFCKIWSGQEDVVEEKENRNEGRGGRINLPWELLHPILRILGHCLLGPDRKNEGLFEAAFSACKCLHARSMRDINPKAILATGSLVKEGEMAVDTSNEIDYTEIVIGNVITI